MKRYFVLLLLFLNASVGFSQEVVNGWYYLPEPAANVWGIGYHQPVKGSALSYAGNTKDVSEDDLILQTGPKSIQRVITNLRNMVFTSLFKSNKAITYDINTNKLKQVLLKSNSFKDFDDGNYYVTQALKADSVVIKGYINKKFTSDSKDAEKIISAFAGQATAAFKVVSTLTNKDTTINTGILTYSKNKKDSFTIVITDPDVFFAVKLTKVKNSGNPEEEIEIGKDDKDDNIVGISDDPTDLIYAHYNINKGLDVGVRFFVKDKIGTLEVYEHYAGKQYNVLAKKVKKIDNSTVSFQIEGSSLTPNVSVGKKTSVDYLITAICEVIYDPAKNEISFKGKDAQNKFRTAVYHVTGKYSTWPAK